MEEAKRRKEDEVKRRKLEEELEEKRIKREREELEEQFKREEAGKRRKHEEVQKANEEIYNNKKVQNHTNENVFTPAEPVVKQKTTQMSSTFNDPFLNVPNQVDVQVMPKASTQFPGFTPG